MSDPLRQFIVKIKWEPKGRSKLSHAYVYLVLAETTERAVERVELRWHGKQGGTDPHKTTVLGECATDLFELHGIPRAEEMLSTCPRCGAGVSDCATFGCGHDQKATS